MIFKLRKKSFALLSSLVFLAGGEILYNIMHICIYAIIGPTHTYNNKCLCVWCEERGRRGFLIISRCLFLLYIYVIYYIYNSYYCYHVVIIVLHFLRASSSLPLLLYLLCFKRWCGVVVGVCTVWWGSIQKKSFWIFCCFIFYFYIVIYKYICYIIH